MKRMKKIIALLLVGLLSILTACSAPQEPSDGRLHVVATVFPAYDFARAVGGEDISLQMLLKPGMETHTYDPTPQDIIAIRNSDVFIYVGGESDAWLSSILENLDTKHTKLVALMDCVELYKEEQTQAMQQGTKPEEEEDEYDEHVWTSPVNAMAITNAVCAAFCEKDAAHAENYRANCEMYGQQLKELDEQFRSVIRTAKRDTLLFGDRFPLLYFVKEYGLKYEAAFPGCSSSTEENPAVLAYLIGLAEKEAFPVILQIEMSNGKIAQAIAAETGAQVRTFYSCHTVSATDFEAGETYVTLMQKNIETLTAALEG